MIKVDGKGYPLRDFVVSTPPPCTQCVNGQWCNREWYLREAAKMREQAFAYEQAARDCVKHSRGCGCDDI